MKILAMLCGYTLIVSLVGNVLGQADPCLSCTLPIFLCCDGKTAISAEGWYILLFLLVVCGIGLPFDPRSKKHEGVF